jgi:hypothetical protein
VSETSAVSQISAQVADIHAAASEDALERIVTILDDDLAICVLRLESSLAEGMRVAQGHRDGVDAQRQTFVPALAPAMRAAVERTTGRTVTTVVADLHLDPDIILLTFTFAPAVAASSAGYPPGSDLA